METVYKVVSVSDDPFRGTRVSAVSSGQLRLTYLVHGMEPFVVPFCHAFSNVDAAARCLRDSYHRFPAELWMCSAGSTREMGWLLSNQARGYIERADLIGERGNASVLPGDLKFLTQKKRPSDDDVRRVIDESCSPQFMAYWIPDDPDHEFGEVVRLPRRIINPVIDNKWEGTVAAMNLQLVVRIAVRSSESTVIDVKDVISRAGDGLPKKRPKITPEYLADQTPDPREI
jgi:hypothetical protein